MKSTRLPRGRGSLLFSPAARAQRPLRGELTLNLAVFAAIARLRCNDRTFRQNATECEQLAIRVTCDSRDDADDIGHS